MAERPSLKAYTVSEGTDGKSFYHEVGAAWKHARGEGFTLRLHPNVAVSNEVVLFPPRSEADEAQPERGSTPNRGSRVTALRR